MELVRFQESQELAKRILKEPQHLQLPVCHSCSRAADNECWILLSNCSKVIER